MRRHHFEPPGLLLGAGLPAARVGVVPRAAAAFRGTGRGTGVVGRRASGRGDRRLRLDTVARAVVGRLRAAIVGRRRRLHAPGVAVVRPLPLAVWHAIALAGGGGPRSTR